MIDDVIQSVKKYEPNADAVLLRHAYEYAAEAHEGQKRNSGAPYIEHPLEVASLLTEIEADVVTVCAAFLHDVIEDTDASVDQVEAIFVEIVDVQLTTNRTAAQTIELVSARAPSSNEAECLIDIRGIEH